MVQITTPKTISLINIRSDQGEDFLVELLVGHGGTLCLGFPSGVAFTLMFELPKFLIQHLYGAGAIIAVHPDTQKTLISFSSDEVKKVVAALADARVQGE